MKQYELKLSNGKTVVWEGDDGETAARRWADAHRTDPRFSGVSVVAFRTWPRTGVFPVDLRTVQVVE